MARRKASLTRVIAGVTLVGMLGLLGYFFYLQFKSEPAGKTEGFRPLSEGFYSHGIDVSHYQGKIDWDQLIKNSSVKISFVFCKATEGTQVIDGQWRRNQKALRERKIPLGAYHYFRPNIDPTLQARFFLKHYKAKNNDLPPVIDVEEEGEDEIALINDVKRWMDVVEEKTGKRPIIYTNYYMFANLFEPYFRDYKFWIANYNDKPERMQDDRILYWQYSDRGKVPGIEGFVDLNMSKVKFD